jgi:ADP-heptose:LPS heptosyltransferase/predicted SAM-dependent methyltransferase
LTWFIDGPQGNESAKIKYELVKYTRGRGLDLGCGPYKTYKHFIGVDNGHHAREFGWQFKPDVLVDDCTDLSLFGSESMDFVFSSHLLEHIQDYRAALKEWMRVIKPGGYLCLYLPHKDFYPNVGEPGANPDHKHDFQPADIVDAMQDLGGWDLVEQQERDQRFEYSFFQVFQKRDDDFQLQSHLERKPYPSACVVRYGGFGDMLQACAIFPELKRQGYHITVMTTPKGQSIIANDPHVDDWYIQDTDQVPNEELCHFWEQQKQHFDKFINLSESVEGTLLAMPGRANHAWPNELRTKYLNKNYLEFTFEIAGLPFRPEPKFYSTTEEDKEANAFMQDQPQYRVMWALAGSSVHKVYPHQDAVIARIMLEMPDAVVVLVGDDACRLLEQGWESEPRVLLTSGELSIRQTLALAQRMDCVVGPETGVLNAVGFDPLVSKVCLLSHSTRENLTRDWVNSIDISAEEDVSVPICNNVACHRLHYGDSFCPTHPETGSSACQHSIPPDQVFDAIWHHYQQWKLKEAA